MDVLGPYPEDADGNTQVLVIIDCFSRYVATYPIKENTGQRIAESLLAHATHFGVPCEIQSDRGSSFVNDTIRAFLELQGAEQVLSVQYSHQENGIVERANKEIVRWLRDFLVIPPEERNDDEETLDQWNHIPHSLLRVSSP